MNAVISHEVRRSREQLEIAIREGRRRGQELLHQSYLDLHEFRRRELYATSHKTMNKWTMEQFSLNDSQASRELWLAEVIHEILPIGKFPPVEARARELAGLSGEQMRLVMHAAGLDATAERIREARQKLLGEQPTEEETSEGAQELMSLIDQTVAAVGTEEPEPETPDEVADQINREEEEVARRGRAAAGTGHGKTLEERFRAHCAQIGKTVKRADPEERAAFFRILLPHERSLVQEAPAEQAKVLLPEAVEIAATVADRVSATIAAKLRAIGTEAAKH